MPGKGIQSLLIHHAEPSASDPSLLSLTMRVTLAATVAAVCAGLAAAADGTPHAMTAATARFRGQRPLGTANVSNVKPRVDVVTGNIMDMHDGTTIRINGTFYWYGAGYGPCHELATGCGSGGQVGTCGFQVDHVVNVATSADLVHWTFHGAVLTPENRPNGIMYSPWVAQSPSTKKWVLWVNILPVIDGHGSFQLSRYTVATSDSPLGPFTTAVANVTGLAYTQLPDAPSIFVDDDGRAYIAFTHETTHINHVQELSPDLLGPLPGGKVSDQIGGTNNEGVLMFKREGKYYVGFGQCCCFCAAGADVTLWVADSPLGPYGSPVTVLEPRDWHGQTGTVWFTGQDYVLFGDRWQSAPDHLKAHDFTYMTPLAFNADGAPQPQKWQDDVLIFY